MRMPGMQKPHWTPPSSTNASPSTWRVSLGRPSTVTTSRPSICSGLRRHASAGIPSINTRQQPHVPSGEQQTAVVFRREEKVAIARQLDSLGVHRIEAGMPAVSDQDKGAIADIAALGLTSEVFAFARCIPDEIKVVKACGVNGVVIEIP